MSRNQIRTVGGNALKQGMEHNTTLKHLKYVFLISGYLTEAGSLGHNHMGTLAAIDGNILPSWELGQDSTEA